MRCITILFNPNRGDLWKNTRFYETIKLIIENCVFFFFIWNVSHRLLFWKLEGIESGKQFTSHGLLMVMFALGSHPNPLLPASLYVTMLPDVLNHTQSLSWSAHFHSAMAFSINCFSVIRQNTQQKKAVECYSLSWREGMAAGAWDRWPYCIWCLEARELNAYTQLTFSFLFCLEPQVLEWCHSYFITFVPPQLTYLETCLSYMYVEVSPQGDFWACKVENQYKQYKPYCFPIMILNFSKNLSKRTSSPITCFCQMFCYSNINISNEAICLLEKRIEEGRKIFSDRVI